MCCVFNTIQAFNLELESAFKARKMYDFAGFSLCVEIKELCLFRPGTRDQGEGETAQTLEIYKPNLATFSKSPVSSEAQ